MKDIRLKLFDTYPNKYFKLTAILDIDLKEPNYFLVVFIDINTNKQYQEKIIPELFRRKFKIGNIYYNNKLIEFGKYKENIFTIDVKWNTRYKKLLDTIIKYPLEIGDYYLKYLNKQPCYQFESNGKIIIVPSNIIAIRYYFLSSSLKNALNKGNLDGLFYKGTNKYIFSEDKFQIDVNNKANKKDIPFICRFLKDYQHKGYNFNSFNFFFDTKQKQYNKYKKSKEDSLYNTLLCRFPIIGEYDIHCRYFKVKTVDNKDAYLITDIYNDTSPLGYSKLHVRKYKKGTPDSEIEKIPYDKILYKGRKKGQLITSSLQNNNSSHEIKEDILIEKVIKDANTQNLHIINENIYTGTGEIIETNSDTINTQPSFHIPSDIINKENEIKNIQQILTKEIDNIKEPFLLSDFIILFEELRQSLKINTSWISDIILMNKIANPIKKGWNEKSLLNKDSATPRPYLYGYIEYDNKYTYFIELQEDKTWKQSTWFFVSKNKINFNKVAFEIIKYYITEGKYIDLYNFCKNTYDISMCIKKHTKNIYSDEAVSNWCEVVFNLINLNNEERKNKFVKED